jgi:hypothetical protein
VTTLASLSASALPVDVVMPRDGVIGDALGVSAGVPVMVLVEAGVGVDVGVLCAYAVFVIKVVLAKAITNKSNLNKRTMFIHPGRF